MLQRRLYGGIRRYRTLEEQYDYDNEPEPVIVMVDDPMVIVIAESESTTASSGMSAASHRVQQLKNICFHC